MPAKKATHTNKKLIVVTCGFLSQYATFYFNLGIVFGILAFFASCGAFVAVHFSDNEVKHGREEAKGSVLRSS